MQKSDGNLTLTVSNVTYIFLHDRTECWWPSTIFGGHHAFENDKSIFLKLVFYSVISNYRFWCLACPDKEDPHCFGEEVIKLVEKIVGCLACRVGFAWRWF